MGGYSQVECELTLLKQAILGDYDFYHLLTGQDILLKPIEEFKSFFRKNGAYNFVHFDIPSKSEIRYDRIRYYRILQDHMPRGRSVLSLLQNRCLLPIQRVLKIDRTKMYPNVIFKSGSAYFSINSDLAHYILSQRDSIKLWFSNTISADEMFVQTIVFNSGFKDTLYDSRYDDSCEANQRLIDWKRGNPYTWKSEDYAALVNSELLVARKFDEGIDETILKRIYNEVHEITWTPN